MSKVTFQPADVTVDVPPGTELIAAARRAGVMLDSPCGGRGTCGSCMVRIVSGQADCDNPGNLSDASLADGYVLACRTTVLDQPITVEIPEQDGHEGGQFSDADEDRTLIRADLMPRSFEYDPLAIKWLLNVAPPRREDGLGDIDRLTRAIQRDWGKVEVTYPLSVMRVAANTLREHDGIVTVTMIRDVLNPEFGIGNSELTNTTAGSSIPNSAFRTPYSRLSPLRLRVIRLEPGDTTTRHFGIAVDIGTTTVSVQLINLTNGRALATRSDYNSQVACGLDVLSRINYARRADRLAELRNRVLDTINGLIRQVAGSHHVDPHEICNAVLSGNTTMSHLLLGLPPEHIRLDPYTPTVMSWPFLTAAEIGLEINCESWVHVSPAVGSYVGGDITAGLLCTDLPASAEGVNLFIDIGTNGELVLGNAEFMLTCACSAGPAFEGGGIDCGMRAALGAIEKVQIDPQTGVANYATIGHVRPKGICGSGMIDLLAKLLLTGWLDQSGKLDRSRPSESIVVEGRKAKYVLVAGDARACGPAAKQEISISETDIENIIRAKAAIYSACALMLKHVGMEFTDLANVYIAGGFGRFLDLDNAMTIGLLPDLPRERFHYLGNTSLMGSYMIAVSQDYRRRQLDLARRMTSVDLSTEPNYMEQYTGALFLPHTDRAAFESVWQRLEEDAATRRREDGGRATNGDEGFSFSRRAAGPRVESPAEPALLSNKQKALADASQLAVEQLRNVDLVQRCKLLGLPSPEADGTIVVRLFGNDVRLTGPDFAAQYAGTGDGPARPVKPADRLLALHYLLCGASVSPTGQLISFRDLPGGQFYWPSFQDRSTIPLLKRFGNDLDSLRSNLARFAWSPIDIGDLGATIQAVGLVDVTLIYRRGDEEFGPSAELFFDSSVRQVFNTEDIATIASRMCIGLL